MVQLTTAITFYFNAYIANTKCDNQIICRGQGMRRGSPRGTHPGREEADAWLKNCSHSVGLGKRKTIADFRERKWQYKLLVSTGKKKKEKKPVFLHRTRKALFCALYQSTLVNNTNNMRRSKTQNCSYDSTHQKGGSSVCNSAGFTGVLHSKAKRRSKPESA